MNIFSVARSLVKRAIFIYQFKFLSYVFLDYKGNINVKIEQIYFLSEI